MSGDLCADLLDAPGALDSLMEAVGRFPPPWPIWAQVHSSSMDTLSRELVRLGFDRALVPECSGLSVAYWNSKFGGGDVLRRTLGVSYPETVSRGLPEDVADFVCGRPECSWVVKPNRAMGGLGISFVDASMTAAGIVEAVAEALDISETEKFKKGGVPTGPFVVQRVIGQVKTNRSPSADFWVEPDGTTLLVAIAEQKLGPTGRYRGSASADYLEETTPDVRAAGAAVGAFLADEGYRGLLNLDFVVSAEGALAVIELNVRQSAPLDQSLTMSRRFGARWRDTFRYDAYEPGSQPEAGFPPHDVCIGYGPGEPALAMIVSPHG